MGLGHMEDGQVGVFSPGALRSHVPFLTELLPEYALQKLVGLPGSPEGHFLKGKLRFSEQKWLRGLAPRLPPLPTAQGCFQRMVLLPEVMGGAGVRRRPPLGWEAQAQALCPARL